MSDESLSEETRQPRMTDADEADAEALARAQQAKQDLSEAAVEAPARIPVVIRPPPTEEPEEPAANGSAAKGRRMGDWFLGRHEQERSDEPVATLPPIEEGWTELRTTTLIPDTVFVRIQEEAATGTRRYDVVEPPLTDHERKALQFIEDALIRGLNVDPEGMTDADREEILRRAVGQIIRDYRIRISDVGQRRIEYYLLRDFIGMGPIEALMLDPQIEDISCDGAGSPLFIFHREFESVQTSIEFPGESELDAFVIRLAQRSGKAISISDPILDAALPDGSRMQATLGQEVTQNGSTFTIRRFRPDPFTPIDLVRFGSMSKELLAYFWLIVQHGSSLVFSGGTASGKTTGLNAISQFIPRQAKIVSIEDTREVNLPHQNWIRSVVRSGSTSEGTGEIGMFELLKASLRQRPDYILVGEVRGVEANVAFQAMATGHTVYSTMHADSARSVVYRLENEPINIPRLMLQALDVIAIQAQVRVKGRRVRRVKQVVELVGLDPQSRELLTHTPFEWRNDSDTFHYAGRSYILDRIAEENNWSPEQLKTEIADRVRVIDWMLGREGHGSKDVARIIQQFQRDPAAVLAQVESGTE